MFIQMYQEKFMRFPEGKSKALTFSYDDGVSADKKLIAIFNKYGLKGTFNLNNLLFDCEYWHGRMDEEETYETFRSGEHEVAMHGARHIFMDRVSLPEAANEVMQNRSYLEKRFGKIVRGMAYPYHSCGEELADLLGKLGVEYARTTISSHTFDIPKNWMLLQPTCHHGDKLLPSLMDKFLNEAPEDSLKNRDPWLFYIWGHSYEFDDKNNWELIENLAKSVHGRKDIWFATNGEIREYCKAYDNLVYSLDGETAFNPSYMAVYVESRGKVYRIGAGETVTFDMPF